VSGCIDKGKRPELVDELLFHAAAFSINNQMEFPFFKIVERAKLSEEKLGREIYTCGHMILQSWNTMKKVAGIDQ